jgi:hypothetical protein
MNAEMCRYDMKFVEVIESKTNRHFQRIQKRNVNIYGFFISFYLLIGYICKFIKLKKHLRYWPCSSLKLVLLFAFKKSILKLLLS